MNLFACYISGTHENGDLCEEYFLTPAQNYTEIMKKILTIFEDYIKIDCIRVNKVDDILPISRQEFNSFICFPN